MFKPVLKKAEEPEIKLPTFDGSWKKQESSRKTFISALLAMPKPLTLWITITVENSERAGNTRPPDLLLEKSVCRSGATVRTGHGTTDWFQIGKGVHQGCTLSRCFSSAQFTQSCPTVCDPVNRSTPGLPVHHHFLLSSFTFIKKLFSSSSLSAIRVVSSAYLTLLIFLLAILIPACVSSSPAFLMMYSA